MTHTAESITEILMRRFDGAKYLVPNVYFFKHDWETDLLVIQQSGYSYDIEIKVTKSDFKADFKKIHKHQILKSAEYTEFHMSGIVEHTTVKNWGRRPNRFYYAVPEGLVSVEEIPEYAGLIYIKDSQAITIKEAPFIHKEKVRVEQDLCMKFYMYWMKARARERHNYRTEDHFNRIIKSLKKDINELKPNTWIIN